MRLPLFVMPTHTGTEALRFPAALGSPAGGHHLGGLAVLFQPGQRAFHEAGGRGAKPRFLQYLTMPALQLFRWSAMLTVFVGFWYWSQIYVAADAHRMGVGAGSTIGLFLLIWVAASMILYFVISKTPSGYVLGAITAVLVCAAGWLFVNYTPVGQDDNHVLSIGIGGGLGFIMLFNVWGIIWRNNKKIIRGTLAGTPPANAAVLARQAFLASRTNFFLSVPMIFFMAASSHYTLSGEDEATRTY